MCSKIQLVLWLAAVAVSRASDAPRLLLGHDLDVMPVELLGAGEDGVAVVADAGRVRDEPMDGFVAVVAAVDEEHWRSSRPGSLAGKPSAVYADSATGGLLVLTDGRRYAGRLAGDGDPDRIEWVHPVFGRMSISLDKVSAVAFAGGDVPGGDGDIVVLRNGDELHGFVESIGDEVRIELESGRVVATPVDRVVLVRLDNPAEPAAGLRVWLDDGSVVSAAGLSGGNPVRIDLASDGDQPTTEARSGVVPIERVLAIVPDASRLVPLASLEPGEQRPVGRRWTRPIERSGDGVPGLGWIAFPGPMAVTWSLPRGSARLAGTAVLAESVWGDCELVIEQGSGELYRRRLSGDGPRVRFNVALVSDGPVRVVVEPGAYGPIQDRVTLVGTLVRVEPGGGGGG